MTELDLYAQTPDLYGERGREAVLVAFAEADLDPYAADPHAFCTFDGLNVFCRNPLHPGPCKGWKHMLHSVAPGTLKALETERVRKLNEGRAARVKTLQQAGKPVPRHLSRPIVAKIPPTAAPPPFHPPSPQTAKAVVGQIPTSQNIGRAITARRVGSSLPAGIRMDAGSLKKGDYARVVGTDQYGKTTTLTGYVQTVGPVKVRGKSGLAIQMAESPDGSGGWRGVVYVQDGTKVDRGTPPAKPPAPAPTASPAPSSGSGRRAMEVADRLTDHGMGRKLSGADRATLSKQLQDLHDNGDPNGHLTQLAEGYGAKITDKTARYNSMALSAKVKQAVNDEIKKALGKDGTGKTPLTDLMVESWSDSAARTRLQSTVDAIDQHSLHPAPNAPAVPSAPAMPAGHPAPYSDKVLHGLSDQKLDNAITMNGTTSPLGKQLVAEKARRTAAKMAQPTLPSAPSPPAGASAAAKHASEVAHRSAPGAALAKNHLGAYDKIDKAEFDALPADTQGKILDDLKVAHGKFLDPKKKAQAQALIDRFSPASAPAAALPATPKRGVEAQAQALLNVSKDHPDVAARWIQLSYRANSPEERKALEDVRAAIEADTSRPLWLRGAMAAHSEHNKSLLGTGSRLDRAVLDATDPPSSSGKWYPTGAMLANMLDAPDAELAKLSPLLRETIQTRRDEAAKILLDQSPSTALREIFGSTSPSDAVKMDDYAKLGTKVQADVKHEVAAKIKDHLRSGGHTSMASEWQRVDDAINATKYTHAVQEAINDAQHSFGTSTRRIDVYSKLSKDDVDKLPEAHRKLIRARLDEVAGRSATDPTSAQDARHLAAHWDGTFPSYRSQNATNAAVAATLDKGILSDHSRQIIYTHMDKSEFDSLSQTDQAAVLSDMGAMSNKAGSTLSSTQRFELQRRRDSFEDRHYPTESIRAIVFADPTHNPAESARIAAYSDLTSTQFADLPKVYQDAIEFDVANIGLSNPSAQHAIFSKIKPGYVTPAAATPSPSTSRDQRTQDALDVLYGMHPKAKVGSHQLATYGKLRTAQFNTLAPHEQSALLGDLSYIATTSKSPTTKDKANALISRFTPPGTPPGVVPNQALSVPPNAVTGQTRVADPTGTLGLLQVLPNTGQSGDGWFYPPGGGRAVWGKYGASGLLLRHVGDDGKTRYLMVQRGPAISDPGKWQFPGGARDSKENAYQGGAREVVEELGFDRDALANARVHGTHEFSIPGGWSYTSVAATVPKQLQPDLSTHHARAETSDAKWMTAEEIDKLDQGGKLLSPLAGGKLQQNVISLFPPSALVRPGPVTSRPARLAGTPSAAPPAQKTAHKPSTGKNLIPDSQAERDLRAKVSATRKNYRGKTADERLAAIGALQGYDDTPTVVDKGEFERLLKTGDYIEVWRGVTSGGGKSAKEIAEDFRSGPAYYGTGIFGNGYYFSTRKDVAEQYSSGWRASGSSGGLIRALLPKTAKTKDHDAVAAGAKQTSSSVPYRYIGRQNMGGGTFHDEGRYAAAIGLDAIEVGHRSYSPGGGATHIASAGKPSYNILNRSTLIVLE